MFLECDFGFQVNGERTDEGTGNRPVIIRLRISRCVGTYDTPLGTCLVEQVDNTEIERYFLRCLIVNTCKRLPA